MKPIDTRIRAIAPAVCGCGARLNADPACGKCGAPHPDADRIYEFRRKRRLQREAARQRTAQYQHRSA